MASRVLVVNGVARAAPDPVPPVSSFLESTRGAYTTTRTTASASLLLFWDRHLRRLAHSAAILSAAAAAAIPPILSPSAIKPLVETSLRTGLRIALGRRGAGEELAVTALVSGGEKVDVYVHIGMYVPLDLGVGACLAVAGPGRELAQAKYSEWARIRKRMEGLRPPEVTELLLSNDGDRILEGSVTNFFVVRRQIHTKKRNRLDAKRLNDLVYVRFNANLKERRQDQSRDPISSKDRTHMNEWIGWEQAEDDEVYPGSGLTWGAVAHASGAEDILQPRRSNRGGAFGSSSSAMPISEEDEEFIFEEEIDNEDDEEEDDDVPLDDDDD